MTTANAELIDRLLGTKGKGTVLMQEYGDGEPDDSGWLPTATVYECIDRVACRGRQHENRVALNL